MIQLELRFIRPSIEARKAMSEAAMNVDFATNRGFELIQLAKDKISSLTNHENVKVVKSGNSAILVAMSLFKGKIMIPDQGGWMGLKNIAQFLGLETLEIPTELGIINPEVLNEFIDKNNPKALFITSFAGYIAEQPIKEIYEVCEDKNVVLVEDASGGIGDKEKKLSNGDHAHIILASTGSPKIVNVGSGGFISTNEKEFFKKNKFILKSLMADPVTCAGIAEEIKNATDSLSNTIKASDSIKKEFKSAIHSDKRGISVAFKTDEPKEIAFKLRKRFNVEGRSILTVCPTYNRVTIDAVCLEVKNIDLRCLENKKIKEICRIIESVID